MRILKLKKNTATTLEFSSSTTDSAAGIFGIVGSTNPNITFSFTAISPTVELPADLEISESSVLKLVITFPLDYVGTSYIYTDSSGTPHNNTFPVGGGTANY